MNFKIKDFYSTNLKYLACQLHRASLYIENENAHNGGKS